MTKNKKILFLTLMFFLPSLPLVATDAPEQDIAAIRRAAEGGDPQSQFILGEAYRTGDGVPQSDSSSFDWYQKAANQGNVEAQFALGFVYRGGGSVPMDKILSYMWFDIASKNGRPDAFELRNDVAWSMNDTEVMEAKKRVGQFKPHAQ